MSFILGLVGSILGFVLKNILGITFACAVFTSTTRATNLPDFIAGFKAWRQCQRAARARGGEPGPARDGEIESETESEPEEGDTSEGEADPESDAASDGESDADAEAEPEDASESETEGEATDEDEAEAEGDSGDGVDADAESDTGDADSDTEGGDATDVDDDDAAESEGTDAEAESDTEGEPTGTDAGEVASEVVGEAESVDARAPRVREFAVRKYALPAILALEAFLTGFAPDHPLLSAILLAITAGTEWVFVKNVRKHAQYFRTEILPALGAAMVLWFALASYAESVRYHVVMAIRTTPAVILGRVVSAAPNFLTLAVMAMLVLSFLLRRRFVLEQEQSSGFPGSLAAEELKKAILKTNILLVVSAILFGFLIVSSLLSFISMLFDF